MKTDVENNEWKAEAPYLASLPRVNPFLVPEQYFETLPETIANSVYLNELKEVSPLDGFTVPDQYFSSLKDRILAQTAEEEFATEEVLAHFPTSAGFSTPDQYFQKLQSKILAQTVEGAPPAAKESRTPMALRSVEICFCGLLCTGCGLWFLSESANLYSSAYGYRNSK
jgi:hypothetical protein